MAESAQQTLQQQKAQRRAEIETNRARGVVGGTSENATAVASDPGMRRSKEVWEVEEGALHVDGRRLGPGNRFHPTERQVQQTRAGKGGLLGKARELNGSEMDGLRRGNRSARSTGADIGLRALPMQRDALDEALKAELAESDFEGVRPSGPGGRYTLAQVEEIKAAKGARS